MISLLILSNRVKKIESNVDNCPGFSEKRYQMICEIQKFLKEGCSYREISKRMGVGRNTIAKYRGIKYVRNPAEQTGSLL